MASLWRFGRCVQLMEGKPVLGRRSSLTSPSPSTSSRCRQRHVTASASRRGVVILPGLGNSKADYDDLVADLAQKSSEKGEEDSLYVTTVDVARIDWLRNAAGVLDANYWKGTLQPRPFIDWYLNKLKEKIAEAKEETEGGPVSYMRYFLYFNMCLNQQTNTSLINPSLLFSSLLFSSDNTCRSFSGWLAGPNVPR